MTSSLVVIFLSVFVMVAMGSVIPASQISARDYERQVDQIRGDTLQQASPHLELADRLLKRVLDLTYDTLRDIGASDEDLDNVRRKRNYIQSCYFHAIACY